MPLSSFPATSCLLTWGLSHALFSAVQKVEGPLCSLYLAHNEYVSNDSFREKGQPSAVFRAALLVVTI